MLKQDDNFSDVGLVLTGGSTGDDRKYIAEIRKKLKENNLLSQVQFHEEFEEEGLREFLDMVSVVSVPVRNGEAFGIYLLECMASGVPVVQPALGAFPEIISRTGGGLVFDPNTPEALAASLSQLLSDPEKLDILSSNGKKGVEKHFHINDQAAKMVDIYKEAIDARIAVNQTV
jgi:glycosyltransferase involved in cell wall biosynthesis